MSTLKSDGLPVPFSSDRTGAPDLRLIHYNDVYHVEYENSVLPQRHMERNANRLTFVIDQVPPSPLAVSLASNPW